MKREGDLVVLWLDLSNACGSIIHKLVEDALNRGSVLCKIKDLILDH